MLAQLQIIAAEGPGNGFLFVIDLTEVRKVLPGHCGVESAMLQSNTKRNWSSWDPVNSWIC